ncbi:MAG: YcaO-like family protein [Lactobacillus sp.]|uniref:YcaO-like family protein n=1 Tax=Bombilactobacillus bombi TaxID=1303590 RepID=UPI0035F0A946|nr:YcaO-like family protein [Lactobacillus sp.]
MIDFQNTENWNLYRKEKLSGNVTGIWNNATFLGASSYPIFPYHYLTSDFSSFEKNIYEKPTKIIYHLSGYGASFVESLVSFVGESSERYAYTLTKKTLEKNIVKLSYFELKKKFANDLVVPLKYININYPSDSLEHNVNENDRISWVRMNSLIELGKFVWMPLQLVQMFDDESFNYEKRYANTAVSTGTASQETIIKAINSAIVEYLQIDSFNLWWFNGIKGKTVSNSIDFISEKCFGGSISFENFKNNFQIKFTDISFDKSIFVIVCEIFAKDSHGNLPKYTVGVQGGLSKNNCIYRSFMEALTVLEYSMNLCWIHPDKYLSAKNKNNIDNLDDNVLMYALKGKPKLNHVTKYFHVNKINSTYDLISSLSNFSKYAGFLNITPVEFEYLNLNIARVIIPELLPVALPTFPPQRHPRFKQFGGIINRVAHPLA